MGFEIERKFLLKSNTWKELADKGQMIKQGYLNLDLESTVRVRILNSRGFLTIKGKSVKTTRVEYEYEIPFQDAMDLLKLCDKTIIEKTRYEVRENGSTWEIDIFKGANKGLEVAEIELNDEHEVITLPEWIGKEISDDARYYNSNLISQPFCVWKNKLSKPD